MSAEAITLCVMVRELPSTLRYVAQNQGGVVSRSQAIRAGLSPGMIKFRVRSGRWRPVHPGVYATFSGDLTRRTRLWAAVLSAGPGAALSHETAAELHRLADKPAELIHLTVPAGRRISAAEGVSLHRSARVMEAVQANTYPPRTKVEETVLDLTQTAKTFDDVCGWVTRAIARELTDETRLNAAMSARLRLRWRADLQELVVAAAGGDHSVLEFRYHRDVERAHGLPESARQVAFVTPGGRRGRRDRVYEYGVVIELDGRLAHQPEDQWRDKTRDNAAAADGKQSLRYGWSQVKWQPCRTAAEVASVLRRHGWGGRPRPCSPGCPVQRDLPG
ncbi:MAG: type IV toxin-antitoxin system AbiEi family antitoxin domain-containing protein [Streptosporangiaceae bacterium]